MKIDNKIVFYSLLTLLILIFWKFLAQPLNIAGDLHFTFKDYFISQFSLPETWQSSSGVGLGGNESVLMWNKPLLVFTGFLGFMGVSFPLMIKIVFISGFIILGIVGMAKLLKILGLGLTGSITGSLLYLTNTYALLLVDGGQILVVLAYAFFPFCYLLVIRSLGGNFKNKTLSALGVSLLGFLDIRFVYLLLALLLLNFLFKFIFIIDSRKSLLVGNWLRTIAICGIVGIGLNAYWILPFLKSNSATAIPENYLRVSQMSFLNFANWKHSISLLQPHWYENIFGKIPPFRKEFLLIPVLAFLAPILKRKSREVWFWTVVAAVGIFLAKGANPPFGQIYTWLFTHIPGFSLFRDSTKFFFFIALSYSILTAFTVDAVVAKFTKVKLIFPLLIIVYYLLLINPVYLGKMTGTFSEPRYKNEYFALAGKLEEDKDFGRIFWIPYKNPLGFSSPAHPSVEANRLESLRPFAIATVGTYETQNFIREGNYMGELFDIAGIKYIAYPYFDPKRDDMIREKVDYYNTFLNQIENLPWVEKKISDIPAPVFETKKNKDKFFVSKNTYFVVGSDRIYSEIKNLGAEFADNALVFAEENAGIIKNIKTAKGSKILLYDKNLTDLTISFADKDKFISPSSGLGLSPSTDSGSFGWWKREASDLVWTRDFLQQKYGIDNLDFDYGKGWSIAEQNQTLNIKNEKFKTGNILYARVMQSSRGGEAVFYQGDSLIESIDTKIDNPEKVKIKLTGNEREPDKFYEYDKADFHWVKVGNLLENGSLTIKTKGDINIINSLVVISPDQEKELIQNIERLQKGGRIVNFKDGKNLFEDGSEAKVLYTALAPTHYKVKVEGLENPTTLFFSETYDSGWELNSQKGYKLYSLVNGFWIDHDGEYDLYFAPQKYVMPGLAISAGTFISCIIILVWPKLRKFF